MAAHTIAQLPAKLFELLEPLSPEERKRVVKATLVLLGEESSDPVDSDADGGEEAVNRDQAVTNASAFINGKAPKTKVEMLAVAARFRELKLGAEEHSKDDLRKVITGARRNFDDGHFTRDMTNAKRQSGLFNLGTKRGAARLSYYGQCFVDALPDREAAAKLKKPVVGARKVSRKKKVAKKSSKS